MRAITLDIALLAGTREAIHLVMATVFALILVPMMFAVGSMLLTMGGAGAILAAAAFLLLASGVFLALYRMAQQWDNEVTE